MASVPSKRKPTRHPRRAFEHILANIEDIRRFTVGLDERTFKGTNLVVAAVERCLGRLTEAAFRLGGTAEAMAPSVPWDRIRGLGNILRHDYDVVSLDTLWQIVMGDLDELERACRDALAAQ